MEYRLTEDWNSIDEVIVFGAGRLAQKHLPLIMKYFHVKRIIDNDCGKWGSKLYGITVCSLDDIKRELQDTKTIIMTIEHTADEIGKELEKYELKKYKNYCPIECFLGEWFWRFQNKVILMELHTSILTSCTLNCKNCNMFMPYYNEQKIYTQEEIEADLDLLFTHVDYVSAYRFLGGEPLLHPNLPDMIEYLGNKYGEKVGRIGIITNGTILPSEKLLNISEKYHVIYNISDYTNIVLYEERLKKLLHCLDERNIEYSISSDMEWCDFGFPRNPATFNDLDIRKHMLTCAPLFHGLNDGKIFYCHVAWSANKCEKFQLGPSDYVDLKNLIYDERIRILEHCRGEMQLGYVSLCAVCGGCGKDNKNIITAAIQAERGK